MDNVQNCDSFKKENFMLGFCVSFLMQPADLSIRQFPSPPVHVR
jgi:hypothetical protein